MNRLVLSAVRSVKHPKDACRLLTSTARVCRKVVPLLSRDYARIFLRTLVLNRREFYTPEEAYRLGLLDPDFPESELCKYISRRKMLKIERLLNPPTWESVTDDKGIFYRYCNALGIPVPKLCALFFRTTAGWSSSGLILKGRDDWERFLREELPSEFVVKPAQGYYGVRVNVFARTDTGEFVDGSGTSYTAGDLYESMASDAGFDSFVIQERVRNHPELMRLSGTEYLQTVRILTFIDRNGECHVYHAHLRAIVGDNVIDNFEHGRTGNVHAEVYLDSGTLQPAFGPSESGVGVATVYEHPKTGVAFEGFQLPMWPEACAFAREVAFKFLPCRAFGWDIAMTPDGLLLIEANWNADPPTEHKKMDVVLPLLCEGEPFFPAG